MPRSDLLWGAFAGVKDHGAGGSTWLMFCRYQCFKSAWMYQVLHQGFRFPLDYPSLRTAQLVYDREVQWTLGAILYKTRFLPLRYHQFADDIVQGWVVGGGARLLHWVRALLPWQGEQ